MATAIKNSAEASTPPNPHTRLLLASAIGAVFVAGCFAVVSLLVPLLWRNALVSLGLLETTATALSPFQMGGLATLQVLVAIGLVVLGVALAGPNPPEGTRAGVFTLLAGALVGYLATLWVGGLLQKYVFKTPDSVPGLAVMVGVGIALVAVAVRYMLRPEFGHFLVTFESQGWFRTKPYKASQGRWVRRATIVGIVILAISGIWSMTSNNMLTGNWAPRIPFTGGRYLPLLPDLKYTGPLVLGALGLWVSWRAVNFPTFADFLIATEAEMNKVSWSSRKRLIQDTIVVLVTVLLFTVFLLGIDQLWGFTLTQLGFVPKPAASKVAADDNPQSVPW